MKPISGKSIALKDVRVIEYGNMICAPYCSKLLADLGAQVIKIEKPCCGDDARRYGPFPNDTPSTERSGLFLYLNTNKYGVTLDLEKTTGGGIFKELIKDADVLIEDSKPGFLDSLGLGYSTLKKLNPSLVLTSVTPFGQTGPYKDYKGSDLIGWQMGGIGYTTPRWAGTAEQEPLRVMRMADFITGLASAAATMSALHVQRETGIGQQVDISQLEALVRLNPQNMFWWPYEGMSETRVSKSIAGPQNFFRCKDGWVYVHAEEQHHWKRFVEIMGNPDWANAELFEVATSRAEHLESLLQLIEEWAKDHTKAEIFKAAQEKGIPLAPSNSIEEVLNSRHLNERSFFVDVGHPETGKLTYPGAPFKFSGISWEIRRPAPLLGQHNEEIYCDKLGYSKEELTEMYQEEII